MADLNVGRFRVGQRVRFVASSPINDKGGIDAGTVKEIAYPNGTAEYLVHFDDGSTESALVDEDLETL